MDFLGIGDAIVQAFRTFFGYIAATIYSLIDYLYHVFELVGRAEIINSDFVQNIYKNIGLILSIFMLFKLVFSGIQALIDPSKLSDKKSGYGQIILRCVIAVVLLGTVPAIFREAYTIQNFVVGSNTSDNVLYKLIAGKNTSGNVRTIGRDLSSTMYFAFFTEITEGALDNGMRDTINNNNSEYYDRFRADDYDTLVEDVTNNDRNFYDTIDYLAIKDGYDYVIEVNWIPLLVVGGFVLWMIAMYTIQIGIRVVQLAYLQIIAPIPILSYISDPEGTFKKWTNQCIATYLDLFFRLMIIYFVMTLIGDVLEQFNETTGILYASTGLAGEDTLTRVLVIAVIIIGLLLFAKKVPELLKDIFPNFGGGAGKFSFGLSAKKNLIEPLTPIVKAATKPLGWAGKKAIGFYDRKKYNLPKPRNAFQQKLDKLMPGRADMISKRNQGNAQIEGLQDSWDNGNLIKNAMARNGINKLDENTTSEQWKKLGFNEEWVSAFRNKKLADDALRNAEKELEVAKASSDPSRVAAAIEELNKKKSAKDTADSVMDSMNLKYQKDAKRYKDYKFRDKNEIRPGTPYNSQVNNNQGTTITEEQRQNLYRRASEQADRRPSHFTEEERNQETRRREAGRSSYNNEREAELARQSIFSDDEAMRQSDIDHNLGVIAPSASSNGAPTAEDSIFNDDEAMRQSDMEYNERNRQQDDSIYDEYDNDSWASQGRADISDTLEDAPRTQSSPNNQQQQQQIPRRPEEYDKAIENATNKYNEMQDNGASDDELQEVLNGLKTLQEGKEKSERYYNGN